MSIIYYTSKKFAPGVSFQKRLNLLLPQFELEILSSVPSLESRLAMHSINIEVIVMMPENHKRVKDLCSLVNLLSGIRSVLVLPDRKQQTVSKGLELMPSYIGYADTDLKDVEAVLSKILLLNPTPHSTMHV